MHVQRENIDGRLVGSHYSMYLLVRIRFVPNQNISSPPVDLLSFFHIYPLAENCSCDAWVVLGLSEIIVIVPGGFVGMMVGLGRDREV